ncbi:MAG: hypothetical protein WAU99_18005, partial [Pseudolabrys sp.]
IAPRVNPEPQAIFEISFCSVRRNAVATNCAAPREQTRMTTNHNLLMYQHKLCVSERPRPAAN